MSFFFYWDNILSSYSCFNIYQYGRVTWMPVFESQLHRLLALWLWASYFISLRLSSLICKKKNNKSMHGSLFGINKLTYVKCFKQYTACCKCSIQFSYHQHRYNYHCHYHVSWIKNHCILMKNSFDKWFNLLAIFHSEFLCLFSLVLSYYHFTSWVFAILISKFC